MCPSDSKIKYSVFFVYLCSCIILCVILLVSVCLSVRQISMLFIDNKDSVFCRCRACSAPYGPPAARWTAARPGWSTCAARTG